MRMIGSKMADVEYRKYPLLSGTTRNSAKSGRSDESVRYIWKRPFYMKVADIYESGRSM